MNSSKATSDLETNTSTIASFALENICPPDIINLTRSSSSALLKQDKLSFLTQKLDKFIEDTNETLNQFKVRLGALEAINFGM